MDLYRLFDIDEFCSPEDLRKKYKELCLKHHPDKNHGTDEYFKRIQSAYEILSDTSMRSKYNMRRRVEHINIIELSDPDYELMYTYYCKLRETNEYKLMHLLYKSLPRHIKDIIKQKISITRIEKMDEIYHAPKWIDITDLVSDETIHFFVSMIDAYKGKMKVVFVNTKYGIYYLFLRNFNTSFILYNGTCNLIIQISTKNWKHFYRKKDDLYCLVKEDDIFIQLPNESYILNNKSMIQKKGFYNKGCYGNLVFVTYF